MNISIAYILHDEYNKNNVPYNIRYLYYNIEIIIEIIFINNIIIYVYTKQKATKTMLRCKLCKKKNNHSICTVIKY